MKILTTIVILAIAWFLIAPILVKEEVPLRNYHTEYEGGYEVDRPGKDI